MIASIAPHLAPNALPFNWFDIIVVTLLVIGLIHGRKNGMSKEVVPALQWLTVVLVCGRGYPMVAPLIMKYCQVPLLWGAILGYLALGMAVFFVFSMIKKVLSPRLEGSSVFGAGEYYLGMLSGMILFACRVLVVLALLNARYFTKAEIQARYSYVQRWYGSTYFPDLHSVQEQVFVRSFVGPYIKEYLSDELIDTAPPPTKRPQPRIIIPAPPARHQ
jgi:uncharacterized membrane protein required for colicin V production